MSLYTGTLVEFTFQVKEERLACQPRANTIDRHILLHNLGPQGPHQSQNSRLPSTIKVQGWSIQIASSRSRHDNLAPRLRPFRKLMHGAFHHIQRSRRIDIQLLQLRNQKHARGGIAFIFQKILAAVDSGIGANSVDDSELLASGFE